MRASRRDIGNITVSTQSDCSVATMRPQPESLADHHVGAARDHLLLGCHPPTSPRHIMRTHGTAVPNTKIQVKHAKISTLARASTLLGARRLTSKKQYLQLQQKASGCSMALSAPSALSKPRKIPTLFALLFPVFGSVHTIHVISNNLNLRGSELKELSRKACPFTGHAGQP